MNYTSNTRSQKAYLPKFLLNLSHALKHNFFADVAALLPATYTTTNPPDTTAVSRIAQLERELEIVKAERDVLVRVASK